MENVSTIDNRSYASVNERILAGTGFVLMTIGAVVVWLFEPTRYSILPACPLYSTTGYACPGCGMTRGFHALFHGDIAGAMSFNALIPLFVVILGFFYVSLFLVTVRGRAFPRWSLSVWAVWGLLALLLAFGFVRNLPFYPFNVLFP